MSTPANLSPDPSSGPVPAPQPSGSPTEAEIRALASQLQAMAKTGPPLTLDQGSVADTSPTDVPPTCSVTLAGSSTQIDGVRYLSSYTPVLGDTVVVLRQNGSPLVIGHTADIGTITASTGGWVQATLSTGFTHNGDSQGNVEYRMLLDAGSFKMQWRGAAARSANTTVVASASLLAPFRPAIKRKVAAARGFGGGDTTCQVIFNIDGSVVLDGVTYTGPAFSLGNSDVRLSGYLSQAGSDLGHAHGLGTATYSVAAPDWVSFNGIEYFL